MKTTVEIADALLAEARKVITRDDTTLRALVEAGLRDQLRARRKRQPFKLRLITFGGDGLHPQVGEAAWENVRDLIYEGRGS
jgi:Arc/MetJ family transcription regulator